MKIIMHSLGRLAVARGVLVGLIILGAVNCVAQSNLYVATNGLDNTDAGRGQSWALPYLTISNGVAHAPTRGDTVWVSNGMFLVTTQINVTAGITVSSWSTNWLDTIVGGTYPASTSRCFYIDHSNAVVKGFTMTNGYGDYGGAVYFNKGTLANCLIISNFATARGGGVNMAYDSACLISNCWIQNNICIGSSDSAGGLLVDGTNNKVRNCVISGNISTNGGLGYGGGVTIRGLGGFMYDSVISNNAGTFGGGLYNINRGVVSNCVIVNNRGSGYGGAVYNANLTNCILINCRISGNFAGGNGVAYNGTYTNCIISGNGAGSSGSGCGGTQYGYYYNCLIAGNTGNVGGAYFNDAAGRYMNCTIVSNTGAIAGGIWFRSTATVTGVFVNCIVSYNFLGTSISNFQIERSGGVLFTNCCIQPTNSLVGSGNISNLPAFKNYAGGDYRLLKGSPCINAGTNQTWMTGTFDLDGRPRIRDGTVDMGVYEYLNPGTIFTVRGR